MELAEPRYRVRGYYYDTFHSDRGGFFHLENAITDARALAREYPHISWEITDTESGTFVREYVGR